MSAHGAYFSTPPKADIWKQWGKLETHWKSVTMSMTVHNLGHDHFMWQIKTRYVGFHWRKYYLSILRHRSNHPVTNTSHQNPSLFTGSNVNHFPICHQGVEQFTKQCLSMSLLMCATQFSLLSDRSFQGLVPTLSSKDCHSALFSD